MAYQLPEKLKQLTPYEPMQGEYPIRLDANESFLSPPDWLREEIGRAVAALDFHRYPDPYCTSLCEAYGRFLGVAPDRIAAGNGSDELIGLIVNFFLNHGEALAVTKPEFSMYAFYAQTGGFPVVVFEKKAEASAESGLRDFLFDPKALISFVKREKARVLFLSNPCNPTSAAVSRKDILTVAKGLEDCLVVVDEAYMDFWEGSVLGDIDSHDNLLVLKTCSKAYGMAAIRLGFAIGNPVLINALKAAKSPYNVNAMTQAAGCVLFSHEAYLRDCIARIKDSRDRLGKALAALARRTEEIVYACDTHANFVFLELLDAAKVFEGLCKKGIAVRLMGNRLRLTAGSEEENAALLAALEELTSARLGTGRG